MNFFLMHVLKYEKNLLYISIISTFIVIAYYHLNFGPIMSSDSYQYSEWADDLLKLNFNLLMYYKQDTYIVSHFFYTLPIIFVAVLKFLFVSEWQYAFFVLNLLLVLLSLIIFTKCLLTLKVRPVLISLTMPIVIISVDLLLWPRFILSDMIFAFLVILSIYFVIKSIIKDKLYLLPLFLIISLLLISRPSSLPIIFAMIFFLTISKSQILNRPSTILLIMLFLIIFTPLVFTVVYHFIEFYFNNDKQFSFLLNMVKEGMIIHDRPETWVTSPSTFIDIAYIYFLRLVNFFNPYASSFSKIHIILNVLQTFFILLSLAIWSFIGGKNKSIDRTVFFILLLSFSVAAFHSFTLIDYDWRYRFPIILPLLMIFSISMEMFINRISKNKIKI